MAVVYVYCRQAIHDAYFFEEPARLLGAPIRPPRFNLKNDVLVRKHVHAAVLSELLRIARDDEDAQRALSEAVPQYVGDYLFEGADNRYRTAPADVSALAGLIDQHRALLVDAVQRGAPPGTLTVLEATAEDVGRVDSDGSLPTHELDPLTLLALARAWDCLPPRVVVVGCEVESVAEGIGLTDAVAGALDAAVETVTRVATGLIREGSITS